MTRSRTLTLALVVAVAALTATFVIHLRYRATARTWKEKAEKHDQRCAYVRLAMGDDEVQLRNPKEQARTAATRFLAGAAGHSPDEVYMCIEKPVDLDRECPDYECLADLARSIKLAIPQWVPPDRGLE